jgi:hypothetical protein
MHALEGLDEFVSLVEFTIYINKQESTFWDPRPIANAILNLKDREVRVSVFLGTTFLFADEKEGWQDVSSYFDEPSEAEVDLFKPPIRCSPHVDHEFRQILRQLQASAENTLSYSLV